MGSFIGKMERYIKVSGEMVSNMDKELLSTKIRMNSKLNGLMEKRFQFFKHISDYKN